MNDCSEFLAHPDSLYDEARETHARKQIDNLIDCIERYTKISKRIYTEQDLCKIYYKVYNLCPPIWTPNDTNWPYRRDELIRRFAFDHQPEYIQDNLL